jgi:hypothetical protein
MNLIQLIQRIETLQPESDATDVARMALLMVQRDPTLRLLEDDVHLGNIYRDVQLRMQATTDQHAAVAEELDLLASSDPCEFSPDHVWTLIRAIKVQSHILQMYLGPSTTTA